jgi:hypothetical protein
MKGRMRGLRRDKAWNEKVKVRRRIKGRMRK